MEKKNKNFFRRLTSLFLIVAIFVSQSIAFIPTAKAVSGVPAIMSYQGRLRDSSGTLLGSSTGTLYYFKYSIYDNATVGSGSKLWPSSAPSISTSTVTSGIFSVKIGDTANGYPDALDYNFQDNRDVYLQIEVSSNGTTFETLSPRQRIASAGFAINAGTVSGFTPSQTPSASNIPVLNSGNLLLSGTNPQINSTSTNTLTLQGGGATGAIRFFNASSSISSAGYLSLAGGITADGGASTFATTTMASLTVNGTTALQGLSFLNTSGTNFTASGFVNSATLNVSGLATIGSLTATGTSTLANVSSTNLTASGFVNGATLNVSGATALGSTLSVGATTTLTAGTLLSGVADGATAVAYNFATANSLLTSGATIASFPGLTLKRLSSAPFSGYGAQTNRWLTVDDTISIGAAFSDQAHLETTRGHLSLFTGSTNLAADISASGIGIIPTAKFMVDGGYGALGDSYLVKSTATGGNFSTFYDGTEVQRFSASTTGAIGTSLTVGSLADASSTLHVVGTFQATGATTLGSTFGVTGATTLATTTATGLTVSTNGITIASSTPATTTNTLYNLGGTLTFNGSAVGGAGANTALSNLASVAINTSLISDTNVTDDLGSASLRWRYSYADSYWVTDAVSTDFAFGTGAPASAQGEGVYLGQDTGGGLVIGLATKQSSAFSQRLGYSQTFGGSFSANPFGVATNNILSIDSTTPTAFGNYFSQGAIGDSGFSKSTATGGNFSTKYDGTEVQRFSASTTGAIGTSLTVGSLADASSTLHVVGTLQATGATTLGSTLGVTGATTLATTTATGITVSTNGLTISSSTPATTTDTLYNLGGTLTFNGSAVGGASGANTALSNLASVAINTPLLFPGTATLQGAAADSGSNVGIVLNNSVALTAGRSVAEIRDNGTAILKVMALSPSTGYRAIQLGANFMIEADPTNAQVFFSRYGYAASYPAALLFDPVAGYFSPVYGSTLQIGTPAGGGLLVVDRGNATTGDSGFAKSAVTGGNMTTQYDGVEVQRIAQNGYFIATSTLIGTSSNLGQTPSSTLHVVGDFTVTGTSTMQGPVSISDLNLGATRFEADGGILSWLDMPVTASSTIGTVNSYSAQIDGTPLLTVYSQGDGSGGIQNYGVQVGTSTASTGLFTVATSSTIFNVTTAGLVGIGTGATPSSTLHVVGTFQATGATTLGSTLGVTGATTLATTTATGLTVSTNGITIASSTPATTTNTLYNLGGTLSFNGSALGGANTALSNLASVSINTPLIFAGQSKLTSGVADAAHAVGHIFDTTNSFANADARLAQFYSAGVPKVAIAKSGLYFLHENENEAYYLGTAIQTGQSLSDLGNGPFIKLQRSTSAGSNYVGIASHPGYGVGLTVAVYSAGIPASGLLAVDSGNLGTIGDSGLTKSAASGGNFSLQYDGTEVQRFSSATTSAIGTSLTVGSLANASNTLHVVGTFQVTGTSTLSGPTIIDDLVAGAMNFDTDAGQVSWIDMPVTASSTTSTVHSYSAQLDGNLAMVVYGTSNGSGGISNLGVGFGTSTPGAILHAYASGATVAMFDRGASDGTVISIRRDNAEQGTISVTTGTVSYNAFTGSHYALLDNASDTIAKAEVVVLTGKNKRLHNEERNEILYGIKKSSVENDPTVLGSYLGIQESGKEAGIDNPILVTAVGNGPMMVVDTGVNVAVGDYLITSDVPGHAMVDPRNATTSYIFARASEPINWDEVTTKIDGKKHKEITVFYESFARDNATAVLAMLGNTRSPMQRVVGTTSGLSTMIVDGPLTIKGQVTFGKDSAGRAKMLVGDSRVRVAFASAYQTMPIINVTPVGVSALDANFKYAITEQEKDHFTIETSNPAYREVAFNWTAVASAEDALEVVSDGTSLILNAVVVEASSSVEIVPEVPVVESPAPEAIPEVTTEESVATSTPEVVVEESTTSTLPVAPSETVVSTSTEVVVTPEEATSTPVVAEEVAPVTEPAPTPTSTDESSVELPVSEEASTEPATTQL